MIIVSVGTQLPFDRLIRMVDVLAPDLPDTFFAQMWKSTYQPKNISWKPNVPAIEFDDLLAKARVLIAHAGIGTVLKAYQFGKPIILVPRKASLGEHRNDHQLATVSELSSRQGIYVAQNEEELKRLLVEPSAISPPNRLEPEGRQQLQSYLVSVVDKVLGVKPNAR